MSAAGGVAREDRRSGDYHGRPTRRLENAHVWLDVLSQAGPRIVRLGVTGSEANLLAETPDIGWQTPFGRYELLGGHRLWSAPEDTVHAVPDGKGLVLDVVSGGLRLAGQHEPSTGLAKSIVVSLDPAGPGVDVSHELRNIGTTSVAVSPWSISQLPLGGLGLLPQAAATADHAVRPNRTLALWPYASWDDKRFEPHDGLMLVHARPGPRLKLGYFNDVGWVAYLRAGVAFVRRFAPQTGRAHPDLGCNVEAYCGDRYLEMEILGPILELAPGEAACHVEHWQLLEFDSDGRPRTELDRLIDVIDSSVSTGGWSAG